ncbi:MAG TPA: GDSL-type esterase/lipase family protein [Thermoanaerobaculia bacterium]|nr:GDSL-type esterase/lipase family protein [Thermoanaerobaculia bacterium]
MRDVLLRRLLAATLILSSPALAGSDVAAPKLDAGGKIDCEFLRAHHSFLERAGDPGIRLLFLGDSITRGWLSGDHQLLWDRHFGRYDAANFGIGGDRTEHLLWRIENGELDRVRPRVVVLLIGTNNIGRPAAEILAGVTRVAERIREKLPDAKLVLMGIFPRGHEADDPARAKIGEINRGLARLHDGARMHFLDIGERFTTSGGTLPKEIMPDALHLSFKGYQIWAEALTPLLEEMMR